MFNTKQEIDKYVKTQLSKLSEPERKSKGYTIARYYIKVGDYTSAQNWLLGFLEIRKDSHPQALKLLGQCYEKQKKPEKALQYYQLSLKAEPKQSGLIEEVCKLLLANEELCANQNRVKHWCDLAEKERVHNDTILGLRLKLSGKSDADKKMVEELIMQEIQSRPTEPSLRIRLVDFLLEAKRFQDAFQQCFDIEMKFVDSFAVSLDWYNTVNFALSRYADTTKGHATQWNYWLLTILAMERQVSLQLSTESLLNNANQSQLKTLSASLYEFDQLLKRAADVVLTVCPERELGAQFLYHYRGQFLLHAASYLFKAEKINGRNQWRETTKKALPLLLLSYQCGIADVDEPWLRSASEQNRNLMRLWNKQGAFRCVQVGRTLLSCINEGVDNPVIAQIRQVTQNRSWIHEDDITNQIKQYCVDPNWRKTVYRSLFTFPEQISKVSSSYFVQCDQNSEPVYVLPTVKELEKYEDIASELDPSSLQSQVYLNMHVSPSDVRATVAQLNFSVTNLQKCDPDTLNHLDLDSFLICTLIQAKRSLSAEKTYFESYNDKPYDKPAILPMCNMMDNLCTVDQQEWWTAVFTVLKNRSGGNLAQIKAIIQNGIEAIRGEGPSKVDPIVLLRLAKTLAQRSQSAPAEEKRVLETRAEHLYRVCIKRQKHNSNFAEYRLLFRFNAQDYNVEGELTDLMEEAIQYVAARFFKNQMYNECIDELDGLTFPFATYFRAEAYKKLDEPGQTSRKTKMLNFEKTRACLSETLELLDNPHFKNHPLQSIVPNEIRRLCPPGDSTNMSNGLDSSFYDARDSSFNSTRRESSKTLELENLIRRMVDVLDTVKLDVGSIKSEMGVLQEKVAKIEETLARQADGTDEDDELNELYMLEELENNQPPQSAATNTRPNFGHGRQSPYYPYSTDYPMYMPAFNKPMLAQNSNFPMVPVDPNPVPFNNVYPDRFKDPVVMKQPQHPEYATPLLLSQFTNNLVNPTLPTLPVDKDFAMRLISQMPQNVVVTKSDPLPAMNAVPQMQPKLTVNIPVQHLKNNQVAAGGYYENISPAMPQLQQQQPNVSTSTFPGFQANSFSFSNLNNATPSFGTGGLLSVAPPVAPVVSTASPVVQPTFSFGSAIKKSAANTAAADTSAEIFEEPADYDPCPDFKPIIALPDEVEVKTGEENEELIFTHRAKLFRHADKEWKERGVGDIKILKDTVEGKYRIVMRREVVFKLCANHYIAPEIELTPVKDNQFIYVVNDFAEGSMVKEKFLVRFKEPAAAEKFKKAFDDAKKDLAAKATLPVPAVPAPVPAPAPFVPKNIFGAPAPDKSKPLLPLPIMETPKSTQPSVPAKNIFKNTTASQAPASSTTTSPFASFTFGKSTTEPKSFNSIFSNIVTTPVVAAVAAATSTTTTAIPKSAEKVEDTGDAEEFVPTATFKPVIELPALVQAVTGEENEDIAFEHRAKLFRFDRETKEWKERGLGNIKILVHKLDKNKVRLLMRREQILKLCCNQNLLADTKFEKVDKPPSVRWHGPDYSENETQFEYLALRFKTVEIRDEFCAALDAVQAKMGAVASTAPVAPVKKPEATKKVEEAKGWGDKFKAKAGSWTCEGCYVTNNGDTLYCTCCNAPKDDTVPKKEATQTVISGGSSTTFAFGTTTTSKFSFGTGGGGGFAVATPPTVAPVAAPVSAPTASSTAASTFSFGSSTPSTTPAPSFSFGQTNSAPGFTFGSKASALAPTLSFGELAAAKTNGDGPAKEENKFSFVFTPRSPGKNAKSPCKSPGVSGDEQTDDEYNEEENNTYFTPVVQLAPIDVKTGEEDEEVLYSHRSKLFRFDSELKEWKERGIGDIKILKHNASGHLRVLMRREQIHKICLNHALTSDIDYIYKSENTLLFVVGDYSEGELERRSFLLRFKSKEIAGEFKAAVTAALAGGYQNGHGHGSDDDVAAIEDRKLALRLKLPVDFFDYKRHEDCQGCRGCDEEFILPNYPLPPAEEFIPLDFNVVRKQVQRKPKRVSFSVDDKEKTTISIFGGATVEEETKPATSIFSSALNTIPSNKDGGSLFGGAATFGATPTTTSIFGGGSTTTATPLFGAQASFGSQPASFTATPAFGGASNIFGGSAKSFSFAAAAQELAKPAQSEVGPDTNGNNEEPAENLFWKRDESLTFASIASNKNNNAFNAQAAEGGGFFGLTKKEDIFTKMAKQKAAGITPTTEDDSNANNDEEYDPHYEPIIALPAEIVVKTGEEDEQKLYANRTKLYRFCSETKQWKERGVGELKVLHHPERGTYRLLMRREQIFKLVLNLMIQADFVITPMQSSPKAFVWAGMNFTDEGSSVEKLAARFSNEQQAADFKIVIDKCLEAIKSRSDLEPEDD